MKTITRLKNTYQYKIIERKIAGLDLIGTEIKSIRNHQISISKAYVLPLENNKKKQLYIFKTLISTYRYANSFSQKNAPPQRPRRLLLRRSEINSLTTQMKTKHYNLIPLQIFINERG